MRAALVDSNILLDLFTRDPTWYAWSSEAVDRLGEDHVFVINPIVYAEVSIHFETAGEVDEAFPARMFRREPVPFDAAFVAGKIFARYRKRGGKRNAPLADFFIGAHAAVAGYALLTRNARHYRRNFPTLRLIAP